jgi:hypothetical protein
MLKRLIYTTEGLFAMLELWMGVWLLSPLWDTLNSGKAYIPMRLVAPSVIWGLVLGAIGALQLWGLVSNRYGVKITGAAIATLFWSFTAVVFGLASIQGLGIVVWGVNAIYCGALTMRLIQEAP